TRRLGEPLEAGATDRRRGARRGAKSRNDPGLVPLRDALFRDQAAEMDRKRREATLHKIQQLMYERAMFASIVEPAFLTGVGLRMAELPTITGHPYLSPYEEGPEAEGPVSRPPGCHTPR